MLAVGGYGRRELFPYSDVDLMFLLDGKLAERDVKDAVRRVNQELWDCGIRVAPTTRRLASARGSIRTMRSLRWRCWTTGYLTGDAACL